MGRTIPSYRIASKMEYAEWKNFQRALPKADRKLFDNMFSISVLYNSAWYGKQSVMDVISQFLSRRDRIDLCAISKLQHEFLES
jgi:hypothetical protein